MAKPEHLMAKPEHLMAKPEHLMAKPEHLMSATLTLECVLSQEEDHSHAEVVPARAHKVAQQQACTTARGRPCLMIHLAP